MAANINKMNTSSVAPSIAYSDLDARTQFVLNRVEFLKSIPDVLRNEDDPANAAKVAVWRDNNYIALIVRCIMDPNEEIYDNAIWATGNLLGSDDARVRDMTRNAITEEVLNRLVTMIGHNTLSAPVRNGICYLLYNLSRYPLSENIAYKIGGEAFKTVLELRLNKSIYKEALSDFLCTIQHIAKDNAKMVNTELLVSALDKFPFHTTTYNSLLSIVGTIAEQENCLSPTINAIDALMKHFSKNIMEVSGRQRREMLWILSNLLAEGSVEAVMFWHLNKDLYKTVLDIAWDELCSAMDVGNENIGYEALFALANFLSSAKELNEDQKSELADDFVLESVLSSCCGHENQRIALVAREALEMFDSFKPVVVCPTEPDVIDLTADSDTESELTEEIDDDTEECLIKTRPRLITVEEQIACCEAPVPSAADLLLGADRGKESANVRRIVQLLVNLPVGEWAEVPADWSLTVADLTVLQHLGYVIIDGWVGINPEIYAAC